MIKEYFEATTMDEVDLLVAEYMTTGGHYTDPEYSPAIKLQRECLHLMTVEELCPQWDRPGSTIKAQRIYPFSPPTRIVPMTPLMQQLHNGPVGKFLLSLTETATDSDGMLEMLRCFSYRTHLRHYFNEVQWYDWETDTVTLGNQKFPAVLVSKIAGKLYRYYLTVENNRRSK